MRIVWLTSKAELQGGVLLLLQHVALQRVTDVVCPVQGLLLASRECAVLALVSILLRPTSVLPATVSTKELAVP